MPTGFQEWFPWGEKNRGSGNGGVAFSENVLGEYTEFLGKKDD